MYLPADAQDRLFELDHRAQRPGSRIAAETVGVRSDERRAQMQERFEKISDELGIEREFDVQELMYNDPDRADVAEWLERARLARQCRDVPGRDAHGSAASSNWPTPTTTRSPRSSPPRGSDVGALLAGPTGWLGSGAREEQECCASGQEGRPP